MADPAVKEASKEMAMISVGGPITGGLIPNNFEGLWRMAQIMSASGLMPTGIQKPEAVFVAVQMGLEIGLSPMQAVQNVAVINGRPSLWGDSVLGLIRASGLLESFSETFKGTFPEKGFAAICIAKRKGDPEPIIREFSIDDARLANLWDKAGPWKQYPKRMLQMRARSWALRDGFGDVLKGLRIAEEERDMIVDMIPTKSGYVAPAVNEVERDDYDRVKSSLTALIRDEYTMTAMADVDQFVGISAKNLGKTVAEVEAMALENWAAFRTQFETWQAKRPAHVNKTEGPEPSSAGGPSPLPPPPIVTPELVPEGNWWDDEKHWKFRRGDGFETIVRIGFGMEAYKNSPEAQENPLAVGAIKGATQASKAAVKDKYCKMFGADRWHDVLVFAGLAHPKPLTGNGKPADLEARAEREAIEAVKAQLYRCEPKNVTKAKKDLGYGIGDSPNSLELWQNLCARAIEYETGTAEPMDRMPGDEDDKF